MLSELFDDDVKCGKSCVCHDDGVCDNGAEEQLLRALGSIAHAEDELQADQQHADVPHYDENEFADTVSEGIDAMICQRAGDEVESKVEVGEREEGEEQGDELVQELDVEEDLAHEGVIGVPNLSEVHK